MKRIIADTLGLDLSELEDYRYQSTQSARAIYAIGDCYYAVGKTPPSNGWAWTEHKDQFFATSRNTKVWVCKVASNQQGE